MRHVNKVVLSPGCGGRARCSLHTERAIGVVRCKKEGMLLQPLWWRCMECVIHNEQDVCEEKHYTYVARTSNTRVISSADLYCCFLPQCEALRRCRSGFPIGTISTNIYIRNFFSFSSTLAIYLQQRFFVFGSAMAVLRSWRSVSTNWL